MKEFIAHHKLLWTDKTFIVSTIIGLLLLCSSLFLNFAAGTYATSRAGAGVADILLDNLPTLNVDEIFVEGALLFIIFIVVTLAYYPKSIPFVLKTIAFFVLIRSFFITLTHIGPSADVISLEANRVFEKFNFVGDLFFSGHTGLPFLMALIFWQNRYLRFAFIFLSAVFGAAVILGHLHYSIDVFGAIFITYTIFHIAEKIFARDYRRHADIV